mmetsp:Transcript_25849/g.49105  ORF Transcript_25849/g.49105 Transcript_25849/m.49105 type:complete len:232 (+) Transcript_25849:297-992(+)
MGTCETFGFRFLRHRAALPAPSKPGSVCGEVCGARRAGGRSHQEGGYQPLHAVPREHRALQGGDPAPQAPGDCDGVCAGRGPVQCRAASKDAQDERAHGSIFFPAAHRRHRLHAFAGHVPPRPEAREPPAFRQPAQAQDLRLRLFQILQMAVPSQVQGWHGGVHCSGGDHRLEGLQVRRGGGGRVVLWGCAAHHAAGHVPLLRHLRAQRRDAHHPPHPSLLEGGDSLQPAP